MRCLRLFLLRVYKPKQVVVTTLLIWMALFDVSFFFLHHPLVIREAVAAEVIITDTMNTTTASQMQSGPRTVFIDDLVGYKFSRASNQCVYYKTSDGGASWGSAVIVDAQTDCVKISVHYDKWTPGDTGDYIHIVTMDTGSDDLFYNRLDTTNDSLLAGTAPPNITQPAGYPPAGFNVNSNTLSITKSTEGILFVSVDDGTASIVARCSTNCQNGTSWTEAGTSPQEAFDNWSQLVPLLNGDVLLINRTLNTFTAQPRTMRSRVWHHSSSSWSASWDLIDTNALPNTTYDVAFSAVTATNGDVYLAYLTDINGLGTNDDIRTARYSGGSWSNTTDVVTNSSRGLTQVSLALDQNTNHVYVAYSGRTSAGTAASANVYWHRSLDGMSTWQAEQGPVNASSGNLYGVDLNQISDERIFVSWYDATSLSIRGDTIRDITPGVEVSALGNQITEVRAGDSNVFSGGVFRFVETIGPRTVTTIKLTEAGSIDANVALSNIRLYYEADTTDPYDCADATYNGSENQFGSTANSFSGPNGTVSFVDSVSIDTDNALCFFVVYDVQKTAVDGQTIAFTIANPSLDVAVSGGAKVAPKITVALASNTTVRDDDLMQTGYHWRNDDGNESTATSATGGIENTPLTEFSKNTSVRLRLGLANTGATTSASITPTLEYATTTSVCSVAVDWTTVGSGGAVWIMADSINLIDGTDTTDIATSSGGVSNGANTFISSNAGSKDTSATVANLAIGVDAFTEFEFSIEATTFAEDGSNYCFRLSDAGEPLDSYEQYPSVSLTADTVVSVLGDQVATTSTPATSAYIGGTFVIKENASTRDITSVTLSELGTVDATTQLSNIELYFDEDTSFPYDCVGESYTATETQFGATITGGFSATSSATFNGSLTVSTTTAICFYVVADIAPGALSGETIAYRIANPQTDIVLTGSGSLAPNTPVGFASETILEGAILELSGYHWRNDNGSESTASSKTAGVENTPLLLVEKEQGARLRIQVRNTSTVASPALSFSLEYAPRITTCEDITLWSEVDTSAGAVVLYNSTELTNGADTTDIATSSGGVSDAGGYTFVSDNNGVLTTSTSTPAVSIGGMSYLELEFALLPTLDIGFNTAYCFRVVTNSSTLNTYTNYPEFTTAPKRDYKVQRGFVDITGTSTTLVADTDYDAPASVNSAFIRITNSHHTGAGRTTGAVNENADDVTAYIENPASIMSGITFARPSSGAPADTRVYWEIIEYVGDDGADNQMIVRDVGTVTYGTSALTATGATVSGVEDATDVVVFITGQFNPDTGRSDYETGQSISSWNNATNQPEFTRGHTGGDAGRVSYAVVEFVGLSWKIQRVEHTYTAVNVTETETITPVNSLSRTFLHTQKTITSGLASISNFGHNVWLSSLGAVSFKIPLSASTPAGHTSVAWVIENTQTSAGAMEVYQSDGILSGGVAPVTFSIDIGTTLALPSEASIMVNSMVPSVTGTNFPRPIVGATIASTTHYELWRSNNISTVNYRTEVVKWPTADTAVRQNTFRFYVDNGDLLPIDAWPIGATDLGENMSITGVDEPLANGDVVRVRLSLRVTNATLPENTRSFKLQYGLRATSCEAISVWDDVGAAGSGSIWRGFDAGPTNGSALTTTVLSVSDKPGRYQYEGSSAPNPVSVAPTEDIEYDWVVQHNGATQRSNYCFRMVNSDGTPLDGYLAYPTIRTVGYTPVITGWRWYDDISPATPVVPLASENVAPINIERGEDITLRVTVAEIKNQSSTNVKFALQFSQSPVFADGGIMLTSTTSCSGIEPWCYEAGAGIDNELINEALLSTSASCVASVGPGCGTYNTIPDSASTFTHSALTAVEFEFTLKNSFALTDGVYYFRPYDVIFGEPVVASTSYPSLVTESGTITFTVDGLPAATTTEAITTSIATTPTSIDFGQLAVDSTEYGAHRLSLSTNATFGYQVFLTADSLLENQYGEPIEGVTGTNASPTGWSTGCDVGAQSCFGYHTSDPVLFGGSDRFSAPDSYASLETEPQEIVYNNSPGLGTYDIVYGIRVSDLQPAGLYATNISYIAVTAY